MIQDLLNEYRQTKKETQKRLDDLNSILKPLQQKYADSKTLDKSESELLYQLEHDKKILNAALTNLVFSIEWMQTGRMPGAKRGIEKRSAYEREVLTDPYWLQLKCDEIIDVFHFEEKNQVDEYKQELVHDIMKTLSKREQEILTLKAKEFSIRRIANLLDVPKSTVGDVLKRTRTKIEKEGWLIV